MPRPGKPAKKYLYPHNCRVCGIHRMISQRVPKSNRCKSCAAKATYVPASSPRNNARVKGDGYVTKQGYHLVYVDGRYQPAHALVIAVLPGQIVHHVDGNKLHNLPANLHACSKAEHRNIHHQLERLSYFLIQQGLTEFSEGVYAFSEEMKEFLLQRVAKECTPGTVNISGLTIPPTITGRVHEPD